MIESYDARRQRYCDKLLYNEFHDSQIEKLGFSQNIEDLKISLLSKIKKT